VRTNEEREQTLNQLLSEMDGFTPDSGVVFVAATNRADLLDAALMRAGRFDRKIRILRPDEQGRSEVLKVGVWCGVWGGVSCLCWGGRGLPVADCSTCVLHATCCLLVGGGLANTPCAPCSPCSLPPPQIHARKHKMGPDVDLEQLAKDLPGLSGGLRGGLRGGWVGW
jgi:hypothetical protein